MTSSKNTPMERYKAYIEGLKESGGKLPTNQFGDLNLSAIATACSNRRQWFSENSKKVMPDSDNKTLGSIIQSDMSQIGTEQKAGENADVSLSKQSSDTKKENGLLRRKVDLLTAELAELRAENEALKAKKQISNNEFKEYCNIIEESGRSFKC
jgi:hypothetical protein